jgi:hypothetical protein
MASGVIRFWREQETVTCEQLAEKQSAKKRSARKKLSVDSYQLSVKSSQQAVRRGRHGTQNIKLLTLHPCQLSIVNQALWEFEW